MLKVTIDFETRSKADLSDIGAWSYSMHASTDVILLAYLFHTQEDLDYKDVKIWVSGDPLPFDITSEIKKGVVLEAHNAFFEYAIWNNVLHKKYDFPRIDYNNMTCTAARARALRLPSSLAKLSSCGMFNTPQKKEGKRFINIFSKPLKNGSFLSYQHGDMDFEDFKDYAKYDVLATAFLGKQLPELPTKERDIWMLDFGMNIRGIRYDMVLAEKARDVCDLFLNSTKNRLMEMTNGQVDSINKIQKIKEFLLKEGIVAHSLDKNSCEKLIKQDISHKAREIIELRTSSAKSSLKKLSTILSVGDDDGIIRGGLLYHGASTGRWTGSGVQPQTLPRSDLSREESIAVIADLSSISPEDFLKKYRSISVVKSVLRNLIIPYEDDLLYIFDFQAIETRILMWLVGDEGALDIFKKGECLYTDMASTIFRKPATEICRKTERPVGKEAILGLGYGMGAKTFANRLSINTAFKDGGEFISSVNSDDVVRKYRTRYDKVVKFWNDVEAAFINSLEGRHFASSKIFSDYGLVFYKDKRDDIVYCQLPSARMISYPKARYDNGRITYLSSNRTGMVLTETYGGKLVENIVQAVARDIMANSMLAVDKAGFKIMFTVHDELVISAPKGESTKDKIISIIEDSVKQAKWSESCPIKIGDAVVSDRYGK